MAIQNSTRILHWLIVVAAGRDYDRRMRWFGAGNGRFRGGVRRRRRRRGVPGSVAGGSRRHRDGAPPRGASARPGSGPLRRARAGGFRAPASWSHRGGVLSRTRRNRAVRFKCGRNARCDGKPFNVVTPVSSLVPYLRIVGLSARLPTCNVSPSRSSARTPGVNTAFPTFVLFVEPRSSTKIRPPL